MGGGIMQLVAYGAQDIYLTGNPQITFFKIVYRRHTNFSMETIKQSISGQSFIGIDNINNKATVTISRNGDLVTGVYVATKQTDTNNLIGICGDNLVEDVEIEIGGQRIDKHYKEWNQIWDELTTPSSKSEGYKYMTGSFNNSLVLGSETKQEMIHYPLKFWFCRNPGLALPLIALQYHEIQLKFTWGIGKYNTSSSDHLTRTNDKTESGGLTEQHSVEVWVDYVYLDTDERRRFSQVSHEYLIEQLQIQKEKDVSSESFKLNLEHPIKELIWTTPQNAPFTNQKTKLSINGHDRFFERNKEYFTLEQPYKHHTSIPGYNIKETEHPVLLNESIFSKDYTYENTSNLGSISGDNIFANKKITDKTSSSSSLSSSDPNRFLFVSSGNSANPSIDFKIGDIVRVNYYKVFTEQRQASGTTDMEPSTNFTYRDGFGANTTVDGRYRITLKAFDSPTPTYNGPPSLSWTEPNIRQENHQTSAEGAPYAAEIRDIPESYVQQLDVTTTHEDKIVENIVRDLTVLEVFKTETLVPTKTIYEIRFNDSIGVTAATEHRVSFEIIARVQNPVSRCSQLKKDIFVYSFCLEPEEHQPSGSCNFSRIDTAKLEFSSSGSISNIYAVNYNVLRIMSGMGGLAYSS